MRTEPAPPASGVEAHVVCAEDELPPGSRRIVAVGDKSIGVFNVDGSYYALRNRCPHRGGALCEGPVTGTTLPADEHAYTYGRRGEILRCAWHGWEFDITTGVALVDPRIRARSYPVSVQDGNVVVHVR